MSRSSAACLMTACGAWRRRCRCARATGTRPGPALQNSAAGCSTVLATGASATVAHRGEPAAMAVERALQASWRSDPPLTSKRWPGPRCSTPPAKQGPPAGLGAAGSGEPPGRWQGQGPRSPLAGRWKAPYRPGIQRHGGPGQVQPAASVLRRRRWILDRRRATDGIILNGPSSWLQCR